MRGTVEALDGPGGRLGVRTVSWAAGLFWRAVPMTQRACKTITSVESSEVSNECSGAHIFSLSRSALGESRILEERRESLLLALSICSISYCESGQDELQGKEAHHF